MVFFFFLCPFILKVIFTSGITIQFFLLKEERWAIYSRPPRGRQEPASVKCSFDKAYHA